MVRVPRRLVEVELPRRHGLVDGIEPPLLAQRRGAGVVLIGDRLPPRDALGRGLVVERDGRARQVVEDRLQPLVEEGQPVLRPGMLAPRADRLVERIVGARRAELDAVVLPEPRDRGLVEDDLGDRGKLHPV
jgi:hypothetical protein